MMTLIKPEELGLYPGRLNTGAGVGLTVLERGDLKRLILRSPKCEGSPF